MARTASARRGSRGQRVRDQLAEQCSKGDRADQSGKPARWELNVALEQHAKHRSSGAGRQQSYRRYTVPAGTVSQLTVWSLQRVRH